MSWQKKIAAHRILLTEMHKEKLTFLKQGKCMDNTRIMMTSRKV